MSKHKPAPWSRPKYFARKVSFGTTWYTESEWAKVKAAAVDPVRFEATFAEWVQMAEQSLLELRAIGVIAEKVQVRADELLAWCLVRNLQNNAAARAEFVSAQKGGAK
jgi:hypothetical protein